MTEDEKPYYGRDRRESRERRVSRPADRRRVFALLPHPSTLEQYEEIAPGSSSRIVRMAEEELMHRHEWEDKYAQEYIKLYKLGQIFGFIVSLVTISATFYLFLEKEYTGAIVLAGGGFGALIAASFASFVRRKFLQRPRRKHHKKGR